MGDGGEPEEGEGRRMVREPEMVGREVGRGRERRRGERDGARARGGGTG